MTHRRDFSDIGFSVVAKAAEYHVDFFIYEISGYTTPGYRVLFMMSGWNSSDDMTEDIEKAEVFAHGSVQWAGCSNWSFDEEQDCMIHCCRRKALTNIGEILARCFDWTKELLPNFDGE